jgi:transcriptional regulator with XRE-family HTH domain
VVVDAAVLLRVARREAGLTQAEVARRAGIPQPVLSMYERGAREPSVAAANRILAGLGKTLTARPAPRYLDDNAAAVQLEAVLGLADAMPFGPRHQPLEFPLLPTG